MNIKSAMDLAKLHKFLLANSLSFQGYLVMRQVENQPLAFQDIRKAIGANKSSLSTIKNTLENKGLVQRYNTKCRRSFFLQLTDEGKALLEKYDKS